jgi:hypothetical protein
VRVKEGEAVRSHVACGRRRRLSLALLLLMLSSLSLATHMSYSGVQGFSYLWEDVNPDGESRFRMPDVQMRKRSGLVPSQRNPMQLGGSSLGRSTG